MEEFPLYNVFYRKCIDKDLNKQEKKDFLEKIQELDDKGYELAFVLIKIYGDAHAKETTDIVPYKGTCMGRDIKFEYKNIPFRLRQMLYKFIIAHIETMKENDKRTRVNIPF